MLKNVVFDLDGTLWQTTDSYVYAYHQLCAFYGLEEKVSDEIVKTYLGVRLDKLLNELFPTVEDKHTLAYRALGYSVEYLTQHPKDCCFDGVRELLENLHGKTERTFRHNAFLKCRNLLPLRSIIFSLVICELLVVNP